MPDFVPCWMFTVSARTPRNTNKSKSHRQNTQSASLMRKVMCYMQLLFSNKMMSSFFYMITVAILEVVDDIKLMLSIVNDYIIQGSSYISF